MQIIPHSRQDWLRFLVFPFKAYAFIAPILFLVFASLPRPRHSPPDAAAIPLLLLYPCGLILLLAALLFGLFGPKGHALSCVGFAAVEFIIPSLLLPSLATA
jgi:hypothetical protein